MVKLLVFTYVDMFRGRRKVSSFLRPYLSSRREKVLRRCAHHLKRLPKRFSGAAIRSQADTADAAWVGGMMAVLPKLAPDISYTGGARTEVSVGVYRRLGRWLVGEALNDPTRGEDVYQHFVTNQGSRLGAEFREAWNRMRVAATTEGALEPEPSLLCRPVERAGTNDAGERMDVTQVQRELARDIENTAWNRLKAELLAQPQWQRYAISSDQERGLQRVFQERENECK